MNFESMSDHELLLHVVEKQDITLAKLNDLIDDVEFINQTQSRFDNHIASENVRLVIWGGIICFISLASSILISLYL